MRTPRGRSRAVEQSAGLGPRVELGERACRFAVTAGGEILVHAGSDPAFKDEMVCSRFESIGPLPFHAFHNKLSQFAVRDIRYDLTELQRLKFAP